MNERVGKNIMILAKVLAWIYGIAAVVAGIAWGSAGEMFLPFLVCVGIGAVMVVMCWPLYGFGMLIDDVHAMRVKGSAATPVTEEAADELPEL